jgi:ABC-2 type transport system permease protein
MRLAVRNRAFLFFSLVMPLAFLFLYLGIFGRGNARAVPYLLAAVLALTVMGSFWGLSVQLVLFREKGILRRFRLAPVGAGAMLTSSILSNYFLTLPTIVVEYLLARLLFHMQGWGNLWGAVALVTLGTVAFAALGLIVASATNTMQETQMINNAIWFVFLFLSGATLPLPLLPGWIQRVAMFLPATYLVTGLERALLRGSGPRELGEEMIALGSGAIVAFLVSLNLFRWEPEEKVPARAKAWAAAALVPFLLLGAWESAYGQRRGELKNIYNAIEQHLSPLGAPK